MPESGFHDIAVDRLAGVILGTAVGDALGLPREGLSRRRARKLFGAPPLRQRFFFGTGMTSDDTEHTCMVGQALLRAPRDPDRFARSLGWRLRFWLLGLPAGVGWGTLRAVIKLWLGFSPRHSGVHSAGNGPAMRAALFGVCLGDDPDRLRAYVRASTRLTHTDPRAESGALLVALAAHYGFRKGSSGFEACAVLTSLRQGIGECDSELTDLLKKMNDHLEREAPAEELAAAWGLRRGITGYIYHTVPVALYCWLRSPGDFRRAVEEAIDLGGDTDTLGAIAGALAGATAGAKKIPEEWLSGVAEWPRSVAWMRRLASRLADQFVTGANTKEVGPIPLFWPGLLPRNLLFLLVVLAHGCRRLLPPY